ncbi:MAG: J domain-containing protein [Acidimicrobiales bacterium]
MTHYEVLGVAPTAATSELRRAYVSLARQHHPDRVGGDAEAMRAINDAWTTLRDPATRESYDRSLNRAVHAAPVSSPPVSDSDDLLSDLLDDTPIGGTVVLPRWLAMLPVAVFAASVAMLGAAVLFRAQPALVLAVVLFAMSFAMFLVAPFVALLASRQRR